jgi:Holliday junction resolvasome RuvABC DNA-binding subunit
MVGTLGAQFNRKSGVGQKLFFRAGADRKAFKSLEVKGLGAKTGFQTLSGHSNSARKTLTRDPVQL